MYKQVCPDWSHTYSSIEQLEHDLTGIKYTGPGVYLTETDTLIIVAREPDGSETWNHIHSGDANFCVHCYNCNFRDTIFAEIPPNRLDTRK